MKLSLSGRLVEINARESAMPVPEFIELASRCGYDAVDLRGSQLNPQTPEADIRNIENALKKLGIKVFAGQYNGGLADANQEEAFVCFAKKLAGLGAISIRMGAEPAILKRACKLVAPLGLKIHYQMHTNSPFETISGAAEVVKSIAEQNFGLAPEPANLALAGLPFNDDMFEPLRGGIAGIHIQTLIVCPDGINALKLNDGTEVRYTRVPYKDNTGIPFKVFFDALRKVGFDGYINELEPRPADGDSESLAKEASDFLRQYL